MWTGGNFEEMFVSIFIFPSKQNDFSDHLRRTGTQIFFVAGKKLLKSPNEIAINPEQ